eukprot:g782.t1
MLRSSSFLTKTSLYSRTGRCVCGSFGGVFKHRNFTRSLSSAESICFKTQPPRRLLSTFICAQSAKLESTKPFEVVTVDLGERSYPIYIGSDLFDKQLLRRHIPGNTVLIVTNETIAPLYLDKCIAALKGEDEGLKIDSVVLPDGEQFKSIEVVNLVWDKALECNHTRQTTFIALGGGVIGDLTGFAAACYQRGVHFLQIPTTVMSQVDSSVGGKTGVNHRLGKNMIGAFYQPTCVLIDTGEVYLFDVYCIESFVLDTLDTLPDRELLSGFSEVIKYGLIRDGQLFEWLEENLESCIRKDPHSLTYAIERSCINKAEVVNEDEKEAGLRAILNLGHSFGHAIETFSGYGHYLHGEAVAIGIMMAADLSKRMDWIDTNLCERIGSLIRRCQLPTSVPEGMTPEIFRQLMMRDKKNKDGKIRLILLKANVSLPQNSMINVWKKRYKSSAAISPLARMLSWLLDTRKEALLTVLHPLELDDYDLDLLYHRIYQHIIEPIDAIDNGISNCKKSDANFVDKTNLITRVGMLNTTWVDRQANRVSDATHHERFLKAMDLCGNDFTTTAQHMARNWLPARKYVKEAIEKRYSVSPTGKLIYLDPSCPWREHLISIEREMSIEGAVQICVHTEGDMFYVQTAPAGMTTFRTRLNLPYSWRGLNGKALDKATEINGCVFVHQLGFIGANKTKEGALAMAERAILLS